MKNAIFKIKFRDYFKIEMEYTVGEGRKFSKRSVFFEKNESFFDLKMRGGK